MTAWTSLGRRTFDFQDFSTEQARMTMVQPLIPGRSEPSPSQLDWYDFPKHEQTAAPKRNGKVHGKRVATWVNTGWVELLTETCSRHSQQSVMQHASPQIVSSSGSGFATWRMVTYHMTPDLPAPVGIHSSRRRPRCGNDSIWFLRKQH